VAQGGFSPTEQFFLENHVYSAIWAILQSCKVRKLIFKGLLRFNIFIITKRFRMAIFQKVWREWLFSHHGRNTLIWGGRPWSVLTIRRVFTYPEMDSRHFWSISNRIYNFLDITPKSFRTSTIFDISNIS